MDGGRTIDINADLGESYGSWQMGQDEELMKHITSANVACGFHAGYPSVMRHTVSLAKALGVNVGAHVGYPDLNGFGRRRMDLTLKEIVNNTVYQVGALAAFCSIEGTTLTHIKAHGALYTTAVLDEQTAGGFLQAVKALAMDLPVYLPAGTRLIDRARDAGLRVVAEAFVDRLYDEELRLVSGLTPGAIYGDPALVADQAFDIVVRGRVQTLGGKVREISAESICLHGDNPMVLENVRAVRRRLLEAQVAFSRPGSSAL